MLKKWFHINQFVTMVKYDNFLILIDNFEMNFIWANET